jgi:hypothetical protein
VTVSQKAALSLLIAIFLFAGFAVLAYTGLFDLVEARFYSPSITRSLDREIASDAEEVEGFLAELQTRFADTLDETSVRRSFLPNQSAEDIFERTRIYGVLLETLGGLQSIRFVDAGGVRIHFSTLQQDILSQNRQSTAYRNYNEDSSSLPYERVAVLSGGQPRLIPDAAADRIIFAFPFYDSFEVYRGTALFSLSVRAVAERLISEGRIKVGENVSILTDPPGIVSGIPGSDHGPISAAVASVWSDGILALTPLDSAASGRTLALISARTGLNLFVGRLVGEDLFVFPQSMKIILLVSFFFTIYLVIFLFFNFKQDSMTVVQNRLKNLQISVIEQYYDRKGDVDWNHWSRELEQRRDDVRAEVKRGLNLKKGKRAEEDIDSLIDKSWDELLAVIGKQKPSSGFDEEKLQSVLNRILQTVPNLVPAQASQIQIQDGPPRLSESDRAGEEEDLEELGDAEAVEELEEVETLEEAEPVGAVENTAGAVEEVAEAEALEELEEVEELEDVEEAVSAEEPAGEKKEEHAAEALQTAEEAAEKGAEEQKSGGLLAAAEKNRQSNIKLAFGDDDIPYIVESSGLELVSGDIDEALNMPNDDDVGELEELEEVDEVTEAEPSAEAPGASAEDNLAQIASEIEFSPLPEVDDALDTVDEDVNVVSPFATMLSNISVGDADAEEAEVFSDEETADTELPAADQDPSLDETDGDTTKVPAEEPAKKPSSRNSAKKKTQVSKKSASRRVKKKS